MLAKSWLEQPMKSSGPGSSVRPISASPGLKINFFLFSYQPSHVLLRVTFCLIITISWSEGSTVFCKLEFHFLRQENFD